MNQVEEYEPPPNPAKATDSRFAEYQKLHGGESWELDALNPETLADLVRTRVIEIRDNAKWEEACRREEAMRQKLQYLSDNWDKVSETL